MLSATIVSIVILLYIEPTVKLPPTIDIIVVFGIEIAAMVIANFSAKGKVRRIITRELLIAFLFAALIVYVLAPTGGSFAMDFVAIAAIEAASFFVAIWLTMP